MLQNMLPVSGCTPLSKTIRSLPVETIEDVILVMDTIDTQLTADDGLWWFNLLYRMVTKEILEDCKRQAWASPEWLVRLDVEFGKLYFEAICLWDEGSEETPRAWRALFEKRHSAHIAPVQFGMAGMNAHINRDLPVAVVRACHQCGMVPQRNTPEEMDYQRVNKILDEVEIRAMQQMATGWIKRVSQTMNPMDRKMAISVVARARNQAWTHAERYWYFEEKQEHQRLMLFMSRLDRTAEKIGHVLLLPAYADAPLPTVASLAARWKDWRTFKKDNG